MAKRYEYETVYVVLRLDRGFLRDENPADHAIVAIEAVPTIGEARAEVDRLNALNHEKGGASEYFMSTCRWYPTGRHTPSTEGGTTFA